MLTKSDLIQIRKLFEDGNKPINRNVKTLQEDVSKIRKDVSTIVDFFDREYIDLRKRVQRIEEHLNLPSVS